MCYFQVAQAKKRGFVSRMLGTYCSDYHNKHNNGTRRTNRIIRKRLKKQLLKEVEKYREVEQW